jgi:hypothetical protein
MRKYSREKNPDYLLLRKEYDELLTLISDLKDE